jgi:hypothetical protein
MIDIDGKYWWVDRVQYPNEGYYAILIDAEGNRARWNFADLAKYLDS